MWRELLEEGELEPRRAGEARVHRVPRRTRRWRNQVGSRLGEPPCRDLGIGHLEGHAELGAHTTTDLDTVDEVDLLGCAQLEGGATHVQDGDASAVPAVEEELLRATEYVSVEGHGRVVVGCLDDQPHLQDAHRPLLWAHHELGHTMSV